MQLLVDVKDEVKKRETMGLVKQMGMELGVIWYFEGGGGDLL